MSKLRFHNHFIYVGVDISIYALLTEGRSSYPPPSRITLTHVLLHSYVCLSTSVFSCVILDYPRHGHVLTGTIIIKINVCTRTIPVGLKCPPLSTTISPITWFEA